MVRWRMAALVVALWWGSALAAENRPASYAVLPHGGFVAFDPQRPLYIVTQDERGRMIRYVLKPGSRQLEPDGPEFRVEASFEKVSPSQLKLRTPYDDLIRAASVRHGVDEALVRAVIHAESGFNPQARSPKSAMGLMQLIPSTAQRFGVDDPYDPVKNVYGGTRYLRELLDMFGRLDHAVAAYNAGEGRVMKYNGIPPFEETRDYVRRVLSLFKGYKEAMG